jgi:tryptophanyl-tRNA synthetase
VGIYAALADKSVDDVLKEFGGGQFSAFKNALADLAVAKLAPINDTMKRLLADPGHVEQVLVDGAARASAIAAPIMQDVKKIVGFVS